MKLSLTLCLVLAVTLPLAPASLWIRMALFLSLPSSLTNDVKTEPEAGLPVPSI